jgi:hypothetical protein
MSKPNDKEKEARRIREMLETIPDPHDIDGGRRPEITANKLIYLLLIHSKRLNKRTITLIVLTAILAILTIVNVIIAFAR